MTSYHVRPDSPTIDARKDVVLSIREITGSLFASSAQTLVNTVNCKGVMGKGVALEFRLRYPEMFRQYEAACTTNSLRPGHILAHPTDTRPPAILNFAIKDRWQDDSRLEWIDACLKEFVNQYKSWGISTIAFPHMGTANGGLCWHDVRKLMMAYLGPLSDLDVEIVAFDPAAREPFFDRLKEIFDTRDDAWIIERAGLSARIISTVRTALGSGALVNTGGLAKLKGVGSKSLEQLYALVNTPPPPTTPRQRTLFDLR
jgi:O-acetyl-ADP-ribose deacetylase (regulator of RNase III)